MVGSPPARRTEKVQKGSVDDGAVAGMVQGLNAGLVSAGLVSESTVSGVPEIRAPVAGVQSSVGGVFQGSVVAEGVVSAITISGGSEFRAPVAGVQSSVGGDFQGSVVAEGVVSAITVSGGSGFRAPVAGFQSSVAGDFQGSVVAEGLALANTVSGVSEIRAPVAEIQRSVVGVFQGSVGFASDQSPVLAASEVAPISGVPHVSAGSLVHALDSVSQSSEGLVVGFSEGSNSLPALASAGLQVRVSEDSQVRASDAATVVAAKSGLSAPAAVGEVGMTQPVLAVSNKSYLTAAQARPTLERHDLTLDEGDQCFVVPEEILSNSSPLWEDLIIGNFPETAPHIAKIHVIVNKIWTFGNKLVKIDAFVVNSTTIKFRIRDKAIRERVLRRGMWNIANKPMMVSNYGPVSEETQPALQKMPMWIELKQIPPSYFTWKGISYLSSAVGEPKRLHPETELCKKFDEAKVFVEVDLTKPLKDSFRFKSQEGVISEVLYSYPWLPPRCRICTKWGHIEKECHHKLRPGKETTILTRSTQVQGNSAGISEVSVAVACASITNATERRKENQPKQALSHPVCEDTDEGGRDASPLGVPLVEKTSEHTKHNQQEVEDLSLPATSHPVYGDADEGGVDEQRSEVETNEEWTRISPKKSSKAGKVQENPKFAVSPSRYSVLDSSLEKNDLVTENSEQGKSLVGKSAAEDITSKFPPPRVTRSYHRSTQNASGMASNSITGGKKKTNKN